MARHIASQAVTVTLVTVALSTTVTTVTHPYKGCDGVT